MHEGKWFVPLMGVVIALAVFILVVPKKDPGRFYSKLVNLSFETGGKKFAENLDIVNRGYKKSVFIRSVNGDIAFSVFEIGSKCKKFLAKNDSDLTYCGWFEGDINEPSTMHLKYNPVYNQEFTRVIERGNGIYQLIEYESAECSPFVQSNLVVKPPKDSGIKYIDFHIGSLVFEESEYEGICEPKKEAIYKKIKQFESYEGLTSDEINSVKEEIELAKTFKVIR